MRFFPNRFSHGDRRKCLYSYSNTVVHVDKVWKVFLKIARCIVLNNGNDSGFPSEPIRSTPTVPPPLSLLAPSPVLRGTRRRSPCVARGFRLSTRASEPFVNPKPRMHDLAIKKKHYDTTACCSSLPKERILSLGAGVQTKADYVLCGSDSELQILVWSQKKNLVQNRNRLLVRK